MADLGFGPPSPITPDACRAGRALLDWTQEKLALEASVGIATVKNFEAGTTVPIPNNLAAIQNALFKSGVLFISNKLCYGVVISRKYVKKSHV